MKLSNKENNLRNYVPVIKPKISIYNPSPFILRLKEDNDSNLEENFNINLLLNNDNKLVISLNNITYTKKPKTKNKLLILDALKKRKSSV